MKKILTAVALAALLLLTGAISALAFYPAGVYSGTIYNRFGTGYPVYCVASSSGSHDWDCYNKK